MEKKSKKMAATEAAIADKTREQNAVIDRFSAVNNAKVETEDGKKARADALAQLSNERSALNTEIKSLEARLEVEKIEMLANESVELEDSTPADALRNAS
jgi:hypothetical protein